VIVQWMDRGGHGRVAFEGEEKEVYSEDRGRQGVMYSDLVTQPKDTSRLHVNVSELSKICTGFVYLVRS
jgi:hypothetical protein